jgi:hypothetical protein
MPRTTTNEQSGYFDRFSGAGGAPGCRITTLRNHLRVYRHQRITRSNAAAKATTPLSRDVAAYDEKRDPDARESSRRTNTFGDSGLKTRMSSAPRRPQWFDEILEIFRHVQPTLT